MSTNRNGHNGNGHNNPTFKPGQGLFSLGRIEATPEVLEAMEGSGLHLLLRHVTGDWSEMSDAARFENEMAVEEGYRVVSRFGLPGGSGIWVVTEGDRSVTTFMMDEIESRAGN